MSCSVPAAKTICPTVSPQWVQTTKSTASLHCLNTERFTSQRTDRKPGHILASSLGAIYIFHYWLVCDCNERNDNKLDLTFWCVYAGAHSYTVCLIDVCVIIFRVVTWSRRIGVSAHTVISLLSIRSSPSKTHPSMVHLSIHRSSHPPIHWFSVFVCVCFRLLETESVCTMCSETLNVSEVKKVSDCSRYLQQDQLERWDPESKTRSMKG